MASTWICETCGRPNPGDLCPGCGAPRPINVRPWRVGHSMGIKGQYDGVSSSTNYLPFAVFFICTFIFSLFVDLGRYALVVLGAVVSVSLVLLFWRTLAVRPRLWFYNAIRRWRERAE